MFRGKAVLINQSISTVGHVQRTVILASMVLGMILDSGVSIFIPTRCA